MQSMPYYQQQQGYQPQAPYQAQPQAPNVLNNGPMMTHPNGLPPMQHPGIPDPSQAVATGSQQAPKRKQVKNACTNCQKACKKCDDARPCPRCIKYGIADTCVNSVRKERKKGIKRGPYKRRQKTGEEKPRKNAAEMSTPDQNGQPAQYAPATMRGPTIPFGYPSNLNQYGQHYDPYAQYTSHYKDQMMPQPYVVNPVYPPMGYPVIVPGGSDSNGQQQGQQQQGQQQQQQPQYQHNYMMHQSNPPQAPRPPMMSQHGEHVMHQSPAGSPQVYYQQPQQQQGQHQQQPQQQPQQPQQPQQQHSQPPSQRNSPHLSEAIKSEPVPSASTSTNTTSSPDSGN
ncbi:uncharacterized protein ATC70_012002 [Mucor velutinosus]|uniref:Zn(2)-C6 fungal-type domain-containing protein n=1 Tax=Mucor velutinosus TaxID=708070 RepID=A0AAN7DQ68_9FUNG|nr:hypothetical protein ATC70_012002 [Mucor velutinosus]